MWGSTIGCIVVLTLSVLAAPLAVDAQPARRARLGVVSPTGTLQIEALRQGLRELGYIEEQNMTIESRLAEGNTECFPELIAELVRLNVDIIVTGSTPGALAAKRATQTIPIVVWAMGDPVGRGVVSSLAQPGGNMTGLSVAADDGSCRRPWGPDQ
jgi:putative ABC transport system substrate-binding protein